MMENVYVIKVKTKPPLSSLYPSERRYSASTVGGLSFVHFGLGTLSLLLGTLALSLQGPILSIACLVPFITGMFAWRRWYIDRNITIFFYGSLFSLIAAVLCLVATVFDTAAIAESKSSMWTFENIPEQPDDSHLEGYGVQDDDNSTSEAPMVIEDVLNHSQISVESSKTNFYASEQKIVFDTMSNMPGYVLETSSDIVEGIGNEHMGLSSNNSRKHLEQDVLNRTEETSVIKNKVMSWWHKDHEEPSLTKILLTVNMLIASLLEIFWSILSARIALRGMKNRLPDNGYVHPAKESEKLERKARRKGKPTTFRPDILDHDRRMSESLQNLNALHALKNSGPSLPLPESSREFRERVERFLVNQAAQRVLEGSSS